ncbi:unnamed protein product [Arabidopsis thaliana]|uniref:Uncharacterized protein n=1 Tax=Arabidopsis thaliana TaxID=3702 RepID=A0A5S9YGS8_ARATH|nr:unnamed protein product [Arabidopsis thaliana]
MSSLYFAILCLFMIFLVPLHEFGNAQGSEAELQLDPSMCLRVECAKHRNQKWCFCCAGLPRTYFLDKRGCTSVCKRESPSMA